MGRFNAAQTFPASHCEWVFFLLLLPSNYFNSCGLIGKVINVPCFHVCFQRYIFFHCSSSFEGAILLLSLLTSFQSVLSLYHSIEVFSSIIMFCLSKVVPLVQFYAFKRLLQSRISVWCFLPLESLTWLFQGLLNPKWGAHRVLKRSSS